jgi:hypothetical protein
MKKSFLFIFTVIIFNLEFGQINPVQNLQWNHYYDYSNYRNIFSLSWQEPETPHNTLIGYNIYRGNELYKFQTTTSVGCNSDWGVISGCDFLNYNNGGSFTGSVKAVYEGNIEAESFSFEVGGVMLDVTDSKLKLLSIFPNPTKNILNFSEEISNITISDFSGKIIKQIPNSEKSINVSKLTKGNYIISGKTKTGETINKKFIKE